jgi:hypothetical protein
VRIQEGRPRSSSPRSTVRRPAEDTVWPCRRNGRSTLTALRDRASEPIIGLRAAAPSHRTAEATSRRLSVPRRTTATGLGSSAISARMPRARTLKGRELPLRTYAHFASNDLLSEQTVETMLAGLASAARSAANRPSTTSLLSGSRTTAVSKSGRAS